MGNLFPQRRSKQADRQPVTILHLVHHEAALDGAETLYGTEGIDEEVVVVLHVGSIDLQKEIEIPRYVVTFRHLGDILDPRDEVMRDLAAHAAQAYAAINYESPAEAGGAQHRRIALNISFRLETSHALEYGSGGKMDLQSQVLHCDTTVFLKCFQYLDVGLVEFLGHGGRGFFCLPGVFQRPALHNFYKNNKS